MGAEDTGARIDIIASIVIERLEELILAMERAADQVAAGDDPEKVDVGRHQLYMLPDKDGNDPIVVCFWTSDDYFKLLSSAASDADVSLDDMVERSVQMPDVEFEDGLVTGGFDAWKGLSVDLKTGWMEDLLAAISSLLRSRGLFMNTDSEDDVVFYLPVERRRR